MLLEDITTATAPATTLGPATVLGVEGRRVRLAVGRDEAWAEIALAQPYRPAEGDRVLAIGQERRWYVIGVLHARGPAVLSFAGDVEISAPHGALSLSAGKGVALKGPVVAVRAGRLETVAHTVVQRCASACHTVRELLQVRAGRTRTFVAGTSVQRADRTWVQSTHETKIDGEKILLG